MAETGSELHGVAFEFKGQAAEDAHFFDDDDDVARIKIFLSQAVSLCESEEAQVTYFSLPEKPLGQGKHGAVYEIHRNGEARVLKLAFSIELPGLHREWCLSRKLESELRADELELFTLTENNFFIFRYDAGAKNEGASAIESLKSLAKNLRGKNAVLALGTIQPLAAKGSLERVKISIGLGQKAQLLLTAARALAAMHRIGLRHNDVKPDNIFVASGGEAKLGDLGASAQVQPEDLSASTKDWGLIDDMRRFGLTILATLLNLPWGAPVLRGVSIGAVSAYCATGYKNPFAKDEKFPERPSVAEDWAEFFGQTQFVTEAKFSTGTLPDLWERHVVGDPEARNWCLSGTPFIELVRKMIWSEYHTMDGVVAVLEAALSGSSQLTSLLATAASKAAEHRVKPLQALGRQAAVETMPEIVQVRGYPAKNAEDVFSFSAGKSSRLSAELGADLAVYGNSSFDLVIPLDDLCEASLYKSLEEDDKTGNYDITDHCLASLRPERTSAPAAIFVFFEEPASTAPCSASVRTSVASADNSDDGPVSAAQPPCSASAASSDEGPASVVPLPDSASKRTPAASAASSDEGPASVAPQPDSASKGTPVASAASSDGGMASIASQPCSASKGTAASAASSDDEADVHGWPAEITAKYKETCVRFAHAELTKDVTGAALLAYRNVDGPRRELLVPVDNVRAAEVWNTRLDMCIAAVVPKGAQQASLTLVICGDEMSEASCVTSLRLVKTQGRNDSHPQVEL